MAAADAPVVPRRRRLGLFGHFVLWFAGSCVLPTVVVYVRALVDRHEASSEAFPDEHNEEVTPLEGATIVAMILVPVGLSQLAAGLLCGALIHGFSTRWRGAWWTLGAASTSSLALLLPDPDALSRNFVFARMGVVVPLALAPLLGVALLRSGEPMSSVRLRVGGTLLALAIGTYFSWECRRSWWFEPRQRTLEATVAPVQAVIDETIARPEIRGTWQSGFWGGRASGWAVPRDGRHSGFSSRFTSGDVTAVLRWDFSADRPEIVVGGVESAPATALFERLFEVAPSHGWTIRREVDLGR